MTQRFSLLVWPDQSPEWRGTDRYPASEPRSTAWQTFERLDKLTAEMAGAQYDEYEKIAFVRFEEAAQGIFSEWHCDLETRLRSGDMLPAFESDLAKYRKLVPALALMNQLADGGKGEIGEKAVLRALAFSQFLETHAARAYGAGSNIAVDAAKAILKHIRCGDLTNGFTGRDAHQGHWANLSDREGVQGGLDLLTEFNWLRAKRQDTGGRPTVVYQINPRVAI